MPNNFDNMGSMSDGQDEPQSPSGMWVCGSSRVVDYSPSAYPLQQQASVGNQNTLDGLGQRYGAVPWTPQHDAGGSYSDSDIDYSRHNSLCYGSMDPVLFRNDGGFQSCLAGEPLVASPDGFDTTTQSPALPNYQSNPPTQPVGRAIDQYGDYFFDNPNYPRYSFDQEQLVCTPQIQEQDPCLNVGNFGQPPAYQRTYRDESQDTGPGNEILDPRVCRYCGKMFGRKTDRERHEVTAKEHKGPSGPVCTEPGCKYTKQFTRIDNFRTHLRKQHEMLEDEVDELIVAWKALFGSRGG